MLQMYKKRPLKLMREILSFKPILFFNCEKDGRICFVTIIPSIRSEVKVAMTLTVFEKA